MNIIIKLPNVVEKYAPDYADLFSVAGYEYFRRYLGGLLLSEHKTVEAINRLFVIEPRNQSSFNPFLNRQNFSIADLEKRNMSLMQTNSMGDRYKDYQYKRPELQEVYKTKLFIGLEMLRRFQKNYPHLDLPVALDSGYTSAGACKIIDQELNMAYVGSLTDKQTTF